MNNFFYFWIVPPAVAFEGTTHVTLISITSVGIIICAVVIGSLFVLRLCAQQKIRGKSSTHRQQELHNQKESLLAGNNFDSLQLVDIAGNALIITSFNSF